MIFVHQFQNGEKCARCRGQFLQGGGRLISSYFEVGNSVSMKKSGGGGRGEMPGRDKRYSTQMGRQAATGGLVGGGGVTKYLFFPRHFLLSFQQR